MAVIAVVGTKGGSGKTTTALCLGDEFFVRGHTVLLVDADPQQSLRTWASVAAEQGHQVPTVVAMGENLHRPDQLPRLARAFDITIVDCPPANGAIQRAALMTADLCVLPVGPSSMEINAMGESVDIVLAAQQIRPKLQPFLLITRSDCRTVLTRAVRQRLAGLDLPILHNTIPMRIAFQHLPDAGVGITRYQPDSPGAHEISALADEIKTHLEEYTGVIEAA